MLRSMAFLLGLGLALPVLGCGDSCESVQNDIEKLGQEVQKDPGSALERGKELEQLRKRLEDLGCLG